MQFLPHNLGVTICTHVLKQTRPILLVAHHADGWNFACGGTDHEDDDFHNVGVGHLTSRDKSVNACADLEMRHLAERLSLDLPWVRSAIPPGEL
jgi:hypothetical protein